MVSGKQTFTEFKADFYRRVPDLSIFDCQEFNLIKVVLDGLKVDYRKRGKIRTSFLYQEVLFKLYEKIRCLRRRSLPKFVSPKGKRVFILSCGRVSYDSKNHAVLSLYENLIRRYSRDRCLIIVQKLQNPEVDTDYLYDDLVNYYLSLPCNEEEDELRRNLRESYYKIESVRIFSPEELENIRSAMQVFLNQYLVMSRLLKKYSQLVVAHFDGHYHKEGLMLALQRNKIKSLELQHGLIAEQDIFYVFPEKISDVRERALFPEEMLVFGEYWKRVLLKGFEFREDQIRIVGDYFFRQSPDLQTKESILRFKKHAKLILVTTQTFLHKYFIEYVSAMADTIDKKGLPYKIILKPHPVENLDVYAPLKQYTNIWITNMDLELLFPFCDSQVSIYSTALYDGIKYGVQGFALDVAECKDYVENVVSTGVAEKLSFGTFPFDQHTTMKDRKVDPNQFYAPINYNCLPSFDSNDVR